MFLRRQFFLVNLWRHLVIYPTPVNLSYLWSFGALAGVLLTVQILTGVLLGMQYTPYVDLAFASIEHIVRDVNNGWFVRFAHSNGASFFFFFVYCHLGRNFYFSLYSRQKHLVWISGLFLFFLMMATAFMGYVLPWGQMSFWGATVITNLFTAVPIIGEQVAFWLWGGFAIGNATLNRFFSLHYILPFVLVALVLVHIILLHFRGSYSPLGGVFLDDKTMFYPYFSVKDFFGVLFWFVVFVLIVYFMPDVLGHPDNYIEANALVTPVHIVPEWYFLPFYAILRAVPNKLGGVFLMLLAIGVLVFLPYIQWIVRNQFSGGQFFYLFFCWFFCFTACLLGFLGGQPVEPPFVVFAQGFSFSYFFFLVFLVFGERLFSYFCSFDL